ncbi:MAG: YciC family protein [Pseudomonas sp.]|uniref:YciC family protein n=1 Tax=Pseudomonas sp. TaxID=306 RepID=UPI003BB761E3
MNPLNLLRDTWFFFSRNLPTIALLCLPWVVLENLAQHAINAWLGSAEGMGYSLLAGLLFYPLYSAALILFIDARSRGLQPRVRDLLAAALRLWPSFALLAVLSTLLIVLGASLLVLPALWVMVKLAFAEYLLVLRGLSPLAAIRESMRLTQGYFWPIAACLLVVLMPLWLLDWWTYQQLGEQPNEWLAVLLDSANGFAQLSATVLLFRFYMQLSSLPASADD